MQTYLWFLLSRSESGVKQQIGLLGKHNFQSNLSNLEQNKTKDV